MKITVTRYFSRNCGLRNMFSFVIEMRPLEFGTIQCSVLFIRLINTVWVTMTTASQTGCHLRVAYT